MVISSIDHIQRRSRFSKQTLRLFQLEHPNWQTNNIRMQTSLPGSLKYPNMSSCCLLTSLVFYLVLQLKNLFKFFFAILKENFFPTVWCFLWTALFSVFEDHPTVCPCLWVIFFWSSSARMRMRVPFFTFLITLTITFNFAIFFREQLLEVYSPFLALTSNHQWFGGIKRGRMAKKDVGLMKEAACEWSWNEKSRSWS